MKRTKLQAIAYAIGHGENIVSAIGKALHGETGLHWKRDLGKLLAIAEDGKARFSVLAKDGNSKLPFLSFSSLPGLPFCIGSGQCLTFCYSFRAWRYPAAFGRQAQNSILLQTEKGRREIRQALDSHKPETGQIDFRLYVDGDFNSRDTLAFWMQAIIERPWIRAYGYSKSFELFLNYRGEWPDNYLLNLSSGHRYDSNVVERMQALPIVRGEFVAVKVPGKRIKPGTEAKRVLAAFGKKAFVCPGKCGPCTPKGHACGSDRFRGIPIIIPVH